MKTILLVEANDIMRENTTELLELSHFIVLPAKNCNAGLRLVSKNKPDLIICDTDTPGMGSFAKLAKQCAVTGNPVPVIFLAAQNDDNTLAQNVSFLAKPFKADDLLKAVNRHLAA